MKKLLTAAVALLFILSACNTGSKEEKCSSSCNDCKESCKSSCTAQEKVLKHVVMFGFKPELSPDQVNEIITAFSELPSKIKEVKSYEWGTNNSPEGLNNGLTHCFTLTFNSEADRNNYLVHPDHKAFGALVNGKLSAITVLDYWAQ